MKNAPEDIHIDDSNEAVAVLNVYKAMSSEAMNNSAVDKSG